MDLISGSILVLMWILGHDFSEHYNRLTHISVDVLSSALLAGTSRNVYPLAAVQGCLVTTFRCSFHLWQQIMKKLSIETFQLIVWVNFKPIL